MITRRTALGAAALAALPAATGHAQQGIGLAERRAIAAYREGKYPALEKAIREAAGFDLPVEVHWDQLTIPGEAGNYMDDEFFGRTIFEPLAAGLRAVAKDQMGRDALRQKLQRIRVRYDQATAPASNYPNGLKFEGGALDVNWRPYANTSDFQPRVDAVVQVLEKGL